MSIKNIETKSRRLESICLERLHAKVKASRELYVIDELIWRDRLVEELSIIRNRKLSEVYLLLYDCVVPVAEKYPVTVRGRAAASFVIWLFGLCHYNPMRFGSGPEVFFGKDKDEDSYEEPLYFDFNISEKAKKDAVERIMAYLNVLPPPKELQGPMDDRRPTWISLRTSCRNGNNVSWGEGFTHLGEGIMINITHSDWKYLKKESIISFYIHTDIERITKLAEFNGSVPQNPEKDLRIFSLFTQDKARGLGLYGTDYVRNEILAYQQPEKLEDMVKILALTQGLGSRIISQIQMIQAGMIRFNEVVATLEDVNGDRSGIDYVFSAVHVAEYAWIALTLAWYRLRPDPS